jgi:ABC-2 type transport system permease protein
MAWPLIILAIATYILAEASPLFVGIIFCLVMLANLLAMDEKKSTQLLLNSLPFTRKEIVMSKYVTAFLYVILIVFSITMIHYVFHQTWPNFYHLIMVFAFSLFIVSLLYPFAYRFSSKYFKFLFIGIFATYLICLRFFIPNLHDRIREFVSMLTTSSQPIMYVYITSSMLVLFCLSLLVSIRIYSNKVFE